MYILYILYYMYIFIYTYMLHYMLRLLRRCAIRLSFRKTYAFRPQPASGLTRLGPEAWRSQFVHLFSQFMVPLRSSNGAGAPLTLQSWIIATDVDHEHARAALRGLQEHTHRAFRTLFAAGVGLCLPTSCFHGRSPAVGLLAVNIYAQHVSACVNM